MSTINTSAEQHVKNANPEKSATCENPVSQNVPHCPTSQNALPTNLTDPPIAILAHAPDPEEARRELLDRTLTPIQLRTIALLAAGLSDSAVARKLSINRKTINRWRLFDPVFASRLNRMRKAIWANTLDRLRSLLPKAVSILARNLNSENPSAQLRSAIQLLKIAGASRLAPRIGADNTHEILAERCQRHRRLEHDPIILRRLSPPNEFELSALHRHLLNHIAREEQVDPG